MIIDYSLCHCAKCFIHMISFNATQYYYSLLEMNKVILVDFKNLPKIAEPPSCRDKILKPSFYL